MLPGGVIHGGVRIASVILGGHPLARRLYYGASQLTRECMEFFMIAAGRDASGTVIGSRNPARTCHWVNRCIRHTGN